jgi:hypothetical protein
MKIQKWNTILASRLSLELFPHTSPRVDAANNPLLAGLPQPIQVLKINATMVHLMHV